MRNSERTSVLSNISQKEEHSSHFRTQQPLKPEKNSKIMRQNEHTSLETTPQRRVTRHPFIHYFLWQAHQPPAPQTHCCSYAESHWPPLYLHMPTSRYTCSSPSPWRRVQQPSLFQRPPARPRSSWRSTRGTRTHWSSPPWPALPQASQVPGSSSAARRLWSRRVWDPGGEQKLLICISIKGYW